MQAVIFLISIAVSIVLAGIPEALYYAIAMHMVTWITALWDIIIEKFNRLTRVI